MVPGEDEKSKDSRGILGLENKLNVGDQILERTDNGYQICSLSNGIGWAERLKMSMDVKTCLSLSHLGADV